MPWGSSGQTAEEELPMKSLAEKFLSETQQQQIIDTVAAAEKKTSGEIVCLIVSSSYHYPMASVLGGATFALPLALLSAHFLGGWLWIGTQNMWFFLGLFAVFFVIMYWSIGRYPALKRIFISKKEIDTEVEEAAVTHFFKHGLYRTRDSNGILLFLSIFEHKVWLLADQGIHAKLTQKEWDDLVAGITQGIQKGYGADAICKAIESIGNVLQIHFPIKADDTDELSNLIIDNG
jgi:putative membrane protein